MNEIKLEVDQYALLAQLKENVATRKLVKLPSYLVRKYNSVGTFERYKALLVAKGYMQIEGTDFNESSQ